MIRFLPVFLILARLCGAGSWMEEWLRREDDKKGGEYDFMVMRGFVKNGDRECSSVFSPVCSEMNTLLQGWSGEYGFGVEERAIGDLNRVTEMVGKMDDENLRVLSETYILGSRASPGWLAGIFRTGVRNDAEECSKLHRDHVEWVKRESKGRMRGSLGIDDFKKSSRIYASLACFQGQWHYPFNPMRARIDNFFLCRNKALRRRFVSVERRFLHYQHVDCEPRCMFDLVAVPYADAGVRMNRNQHDFTRYTIYLVPKKVKGDLNGVWREFERVSGRDIAKFLVDKCTQDNEIILIVPEIKELESKLDLKVLLRDTSGDVPANHVESRMLACVSIHEQDEGVIVAETFSSSSMISEAFYINVNRPYVLMVYDKTVERILLAVKDAGRLSTNDRSKMEDDCGGCDCGGANCMFLDCGGCDCTCGGSGCDCDFDCCDCGGCAI